MKNKTRWDALSMRDRASLIRLYAQGGVLDLKQMKNHYNSFETGGDKVNYRIKGQDWSTWTPSQVQEAIDWGVAYPEQFFGEEGAELRDRLSRAGMADSVIGSIYSMAPKEIQEAVGDRYKSTAQREAEYASSITSAIDNAGKDIYNVADTVTGFMPGPIGGINWGAHMAADALTGNWGKVAGDVAMAGLMGLGATAVSKAANKVRKALDVGKIDLNVDGISGKLYSDAFYHDDFAQLQRDFLLDQLGVDTPIITSGVGRNVGLGELAQSSPAPIGMGIFNNRTLRMMASQGDAAASAELARNPFEIESLGGGYMLKSLMRGNPLEKQISKNGTVNVNNIRALINKSSKVDKAVVDEVLASEEFAGKKVIDYNKFRKAVQDELITYERTPDTRWQGYGMNRIGMSTKKNNAEDIEESINNFILDHNLEYMGRGTDGVPEYYDLQERRTVRYDELYRLAQTGELELGKLPKVETYTFSSSRIPDGSSKHYDANTLGHSRTYTTADEPNVLHVMESQSDWAQEGKEANKKRRIKSLNREEVEANINSLRRNIARDEAILEEGIGRNGAPLTRAERFAIDQTIGVEQQELEDFEQWLRDIDSLPVVSNSQINQEDYLIDNFTTRQIQENLRYAAEHNQTKMRYPTRETAAKIEGYPEREAYFDETGKDITKSGKSMYEVDQAVMVKYEEVDDQLTKLRREGDIIAEWLGAQELAPQGDKALFDKINEARERLNSIDKEISKLRVKHRDLYDSMYTLKPGITKKVVYDYEDILKRYSAFPKQYQKLFKGAEVRTVTDPKGNTWYEVDVPENYLQQEWAYANGGPLVNMFYTGGDKNTMKNLAYRIGAYVHDGAGATPFGILKALTSPQHDYDELKAYLWGPENAGFEPYTGNSTKPYLGDNIPTYNATINPNGQYVFPENMKGFIEEVANRNGNIYLNADLMPGSDSVRYDAANYPVNLFYDTNGNIAGNAADLYDFGLNYGTHYKTPKWQIKAMRKQGSPYAVRQDNIPFVFSNSPEAENTVTAFSYGEMGNKNESDEAIINAMSRLGNGTIEPASITFEYPERLENYASGGKIHIKPENRGKFTALKKRTGKTASWFIAHGTPAQKKMATFALNAAKWHKK